MLPMLKAGGWPTLAMGLLLLLACFDTLLAWRARGAAPAGTLRRLRFAVDYGSKLGLLGTVYGMMCATATGSLDAMADNIGVMLGTTALGLVLELQGSLGLRLTQASVGGPAPVEGAP
ncbi:MAG: MotA/TolQ/ExbB proton channel family protein [Myxococcales bacterium]|nr:MotA/TolQ/ExbB proton channel family protein [Myxococcales bacterium]